MGLWDPWNNQEQKNPGDALTKGIGTPWGPGNNQSLDFGKGTPWGGKENQAPGDPNYKTDPNSIDTGVDYNGMKKSMEQGLRLQRARGDVNTKQGISHANPYGASSETGRAVGQSGVDLEAGINQGNANIDRQAYQDKVQAMNQYNTNLERQYKLQKEKSDKEDADRAKWQDKAGSVLTAGLGG